MLPALLAAPVRAQPVFPKLTGRVVDAADILPAATEADLTARLARLEQETGRQLVVATLPSLQGYEIEDFGYQLGRAWGIGGREADDGALLIIAPNERRVRLEVGYGLEPVLTDALSSTIVNQRILPAFRRGDLSGGIVAGTDAIIEQLALPDGEARARAAAAATAARGQGGEPGGGWWLLLWVGLLLLFLFRRRPGRRHGRRRYGAPVILWGPGIGGGWGGWGGGGSGGFGGGFGGGFSGGGGSFGGGGSSGSW